MMFLSRLPNKRKIILAFASAFLILLGGGIFWMQKLASAPPKTMALNQEELAQAIKPSIVRIIQHATGQATLPAININLEKLTVKIDSSKPAAIKKIDRYMSGSGFIVNPDGYILTNAHVASEKAIEQLYIEEQIKAELAEQAKSLNSSDLENLSQNEQALEELFKQSLDLVKERGTFKVKSSLVVLNPNSTQVYLNNLLSNGFPAEVVALNENFLEDEKDVALLKIEEQNLPAMKLGDDNLVSVGNRIFVFGFPSSAELNLKNPLESSFTGGIIGALKFSQSKDFHIFQTDAKVSQGSSGGPLLNDRGEAVGIVTFETGQEARATGDNFAFAIPIHLAQSVLQQNRVANTPGAYLTHLSAGLSYYHARQCQKATREFQAAEQTNPSFNGEKYLNPYLQKCEQMVSGGQSLDNGWQQALARAKTAASLTWFVVAGRIVLVVLVAWAFWLLFKRMQRDEREVDELSVELEQEKKETGELMALLAKRGVSLPSPEDELHAATRQELNIPHPHIIDYVKEARQVGLKDGQIKEELGKAGWSEEEVSRAFNSAA